MENHSSRRSIRLNGYNYSLEGAYFITICVEHKDHRFGHIADSAMHLNEAGQMISERILAIPAKFSGTLIDSYVVMPNHIHFILTLLGYQSTNESIPNGGLVADGGYVGAAHRGRPLSDRQGRKSLDENTDDNTTIDKNNVPAIRGPGGPKAGGHEGPPLHIHHPETAQADGINVPSVADVVGWFKASTTNYYIRGVKEGRYPAFNRRLWQRNYYEHIIRSEVAYNQIDEYIRTNPMQWAEDRLR